MKKLILLTSLFVVFQGNLAKATSPHQLGLLLMQMLRIFSEDHINKTKELIKAGADVNAKDNLNYTPLQTAASLGYAKVVKLLLEAGANLNVNRWNWPMNQGTRKLLESVIEVEENINKFQDHDEIKDLLISRWINLYLKTKEEKYLNILDQVIPKQELEDKLKSMIKGLQNEEIKEKDRDRQKLLKIRKLLAVKDTEREVEIRNLLTKVKNKMNVSRKFCDINVF